MNDDHPLVLYIHSLSTALTTHHTQLHHHARTQSHLNLLSREISILKQELSSLRAQASSLPTSTDSSIKINQLSLALRALNEKLEFTERVLLERTKQYNHVSADVSAAKSTMDAAYDLVSRLYAKEQESILRQTELQTKLRLEEEKSKSNELVIQEYADLVRKLEGRRSSITSSRKEHHHQSAIEHLSEEFKSQTTTLQHQLSTSQHDLCLLQTQLDAQTKVNQTLLSQLSELQLELDKQKRDDNTASKMVSRYMKFSQQSTNALQTTLTSLQSRHTSTLTSYTSQIHLLQTHLQNSLPPSFNHIHTQLLKESFGRRQETKFRLHLLRREEKLVEELKRWLRRNEERLSVIQDDDDRDAKIFFMEMIQDAKIIIDHIDNPIQINSQNPPISGSLARFVTIQSTVHDLLERLHYEQERRMELEELVGVGGESNEREEDDRVGGEKELDVVKESMESVVERDDGRIYPLSSSSTNGVSEESTARIPDDSIAQPKVDVHQDVEFSVKGATEEVIYPLSSSSSNDISEESTARIPDDSIAQPKVNVHQDVESLTKEPTGEVVERIYPLSSSYTNDLSEESTVHVQVPIPEIVEPKERKEDAVIDTAKDEVEVVVNEEIKDTIINMAKDEVKAVVNEEVKGTDAGSIDQSSEKETGDSQLEVDPSSLPSSSPPSSSPSSENTKPPHPLLKPLHQTRNRYTHIQNSFHDCHIALENLKSHFTSSSSSPPQTINKKPNIPYESIRTIVQRLDDYTEDVRVELEIRILDEEVLGRGYETLLMMCGGGGGGGGEGEWNEEEVLAFVNGTDPVIKKALKGFERKLKDLEEDVAVIKKVVYSLDDDGDDDDDDEDEDDDDNHKLKKKKIISTPDSLSTDTLVASPTPGWISSWISPSRSTIPIPQSQLQPPSHLPNLTFGKIMTNRPRLISTSTSSSSSNLNSNSILRRTVSSLGLSSSHNHSESSMKLYHGGIHSRMTTGDVIKVLQLKTSMPELLVNRNELDVTEEEEDNNNNNNANGVPFKPGLISTFSSLGSTTPITATLKSSSFALGMGMRGRGGGGNRGLRGGRGILGSVGLDDERRRRRVVSAAAAAPASSTVLKKVVDGGDKGKDVSKEDVD